MKTKFHENVLEKELKLAVKFFGQKQQKMTRLHGFNGLAEKDWATWNVNCFQDQFQSEICQKTVKRRVKSELNVF